MHCFNIIISTSEIYLKAAEITSVLLLDSGLELDNVNFYTCVLKSQNRSYTKSRYIIYTVMFPSYCCVAAVMSRYSVSWLLPPSLLIITLLNDQLYQFNTFL